MASLDQPFLLPQDMRDWLPKDHFAYFVLDLVKQLMVDASELLRGYRLDGRGAAAYHPIAMLALLVYAYCDGERSSRRIEARCRTDVGFAADDRGAGARSLHHCSVSGSA